MRLLKIPHEDALSILEHYKPDPKIKALAESRQTPYALIKGAMEQEMYYDAVLFLAHALPVRESVWWAASCASVRHDWSEDEKNAIHAAIAWVHTPDEVSRRHAEKMANIAELQTGAGWAATAAFWSGGSIIAADQPVVPPPPYLYAHAVAGSINLTALLPDGAKADELFHQFIEIGFDIAHGGNGKINK